MADWFRHTQWNDEIAAAFDARLRRARDKAQYLNIQAYTLLGACPAVAADLCRRAIAINDPGQTARAGLYLGTALALEGDLDGAIAALEAAIDAQRNDPRFRTDAHLDQALLVAIAKRADLYEVALDRLGADRSLPLAEQDLAAIVAQALIGSDRGDNVAEIAMLALEALGQPGGVEGALPPYVDLAALRGRLVGAAKS